LPELRRRIRIGVIVVVVLALGAALLVRRAQTRRVQELAARLTGCPAPQIDATRKGDEAEAWYVEACGIEGVLRCDDATAGCIVIPDGP
jgi:hypothetical protein